MSSGEFVGMVADDPLNKIDLKTFHCEILNDHDSIKNEEAAYREIEPVRRIDMPWCNGTMNRSSRTYRK